jgi:hypothetical protein
MIILLCGPLKKYLYATYYFYISLSQYPLLNKLPKDIILFKLRSVSEKITEYMAIFAM